MPGVCCKRKYKRMGCATMSFTWRIFFTTPVRIVSLGVDEVLSTEFEVDDSGLLTGRFSVHNCFGKEKVKRLLLVEPDRDNYYLYAYGDSRGDKEMFKFSDEYKKL